MQIALLPGGLVAIQNKIKAYDSALQANQVKIYCKINLTVRTGQSYSHLAQRFYDCVLLHLGEAPSALTTGENQPPSTRTSCIKQSPLQVSTLRR